jgi:simple sugar transport system ATP-binding protein
LREVLRVCDRITVLREGRNITTLTRTEAAEEIFVRAMVGEEMDIKDSVYFSQAAKIGKPVEDGRAPALEVVDVELKTNEGIPRLSNVNFKVRHGEIFGVAGVAGNGQRELAECVVGVVFPTSGTIKIDGKDVTRVPIRELLKGEVAYIPEDRLHDGFLPKANVAQNLILGYHRQPPYSNGTFINWDVVFDKVRHQIQEYNIKTSGPEDPGGNLSGGNIQRVMIARAFSMPSKVLVAHNPTRGLDIPSMDFVYTRLLERKDAGAATLLISEDLDELLKICDRIAVLFRGQIFGILGREKFDKYAIGRLMSGIRDEETVESRVAS